MPPKKMSRRSLFRSGAALAAVGVSTALPEPAPAAPPPLEFGPNLYESIGVAPLVNCRGTYTIITGSETLPEVKRAMDAASRAYVHMDELMEAVGRRLAELTRAEWGIVTAGCAAALTHATSACISGGDPEKMQRVPNLAGLKNEVVVPRYSRNEYDHAVRMLGVKMVEVETAAQFEAALGPQTAMVMILSCPAAETGELSIANACAMARRKGVPVIVDAAAETLTIPNIHLAHGAHMVAYSGGKCLRGPQAAGLLLGQQDLVRAAWINSAPHHAFGRSLKVGKEEIMGMLAAVEMWVKRDHDAEWKQWQAWLDHIAAQATQVPGVTSEILQPEDLSNRAPRLRLHWDAARIGITGTEVEELLLHGQPRVAVNESSGTRRDHRPSSLTIMPYMMMPGDDKIAAAAIHKLLSNPPHIAVPDPEPAAVDVAGEWVADLTFVSGSSRHHLTVEQRDGQLSGMHHGDVLSGKLTGAVEGRRVTIRSSQRIEGATLHYEFSGDVADGRIAGLVKLGEYGQAHWLAQKLPAKGLSPMIRIVTLEREYGAGGSAIAQNLGEKLNWKVWDTALTAEIARMARCDQSSVARLEERVDPLFYRLMKVFMRGSYERSLPVSGLENLDADSMVVFMQRVIESAAAAGNCVIVGRGAPYVLRDRPDTFRVFVYAPLEEKIRRVRDLGKTEAEAIELVDAIDQERATFVKKYFGKDWPSRHLYHLMLNSAVGDDAVVRTIMDEIRTLNEAPAAQKA